MFFKRKDPKPQHRLTYTDVADPLASYAKYSFELDGHKWPSVEHYFHGMKFGDAAYIKEIRDAPNPEAAAKLGKSKKYDRRKDWAKVQTTVMTRGTYIKCRTHTEVTTALLDTGELDIVDASMYDYFWGIGRDGRGENQFGKMLMQVRQKLLEEKLAESGE